MTASAKTGKQKGLAAIANSDGVIAALAIDQRSALRSLLARATNIPAENVPAESLVQFKELVSSVLTPHASAILLDPEYGLPAAARRAPSAGLLLAYEQTGYDKNVPGRMPRLLDGWSAQRLVDAGADAVKLLLYYSSRSSATVNDIKHKFVEKIGAECADSAVPFFLELVSFADGMNEKGLDFARIKPEIVSAGMTEFSKQKYGVDVLKVGLPRPASKSLAGSWISCCRWRATPFPARSDESLFTSRELRSRSIYLPFGRRKQRDISVRVGTCL